MPCGRDLRRDVLVRHFQNRPPIAIDPDPTRLTTGVDAHFGFAAIEAQDGMVELTDLLGFGYNIVANERAPKTIFGGVGKATVDYVV